MKSNDFNAICSNDLNFLPSKAEIERRRRARMNASLDKLKMFHLIKSPTIESKFEKIETLNLTIKYLQSISNDQRRGSEKTAYTGFKDGFETAQKAVTSFIYHRCPSSISSSLVASVNAELSAVFDQSFKSMNWLRSVYGNNATGEKQSSAKKPKKPEMNLPQFGRQSSSSLLQLYSSPVSHSHNIPPIFESPESAYTNQSLLSLLSLSTMSSSSSPSSSSLSAKGSDENLDQSNSTAEFVCITCDGNCICNRN
ncbi:Helix-loop-helix DNA-binding domain family protein [Brugia pahangi]